MKLNIKGKESAMNLEVQHKELKLLCAFALIFILIFNGYLDKIPGIDILSAILTLMEAN